VIASTPWQTVEKGPIAVLLRKIQTLACGKYASALSFTCALHSNLFEQSAEISFSTVC